ncbi:MAG: DUF4268 domain-containing protein [Candidatus Abyssobacteria bacterium SURF_17]|jgi:hypothetical protein|uniref:DUF4268 domain-containing protein n=1 Tax=Candidatus Abyssobacteria bacterium SURF_17 TaxID=2093361 RepID=A0A419EQZ1_9BACT|nr:MAG: DUF4268 domain-containing protein [Candidatus Abyssubacteria bacterium SURF_17]
MVEKLEQVPVREIWKHEAYDFTSWLFENCDSLSERIGLSISPVEKEKSVGSFNVDILAEDASGRAVIIENQLAPTDHDHLGKLLTYLSNLDAKVAIWISTDPRPEHVVAINYLNEVVPQDTHFYLVRLQAFRIAGSGPAPYFEVEAGPSEERTAGGKVKKEFAERDKIRYEFFQQLLEASNKATNLFSSVSPPAYQNWVTAGAGKSGLAWVYAAMKKMAKVELFLGHSDFTVNKSRFEKLRRQKEDIEDKFGEALIWEFSDSRKQQYIRSICPFGTLDDTEKWPDIQKDMVDRMVRLEKAIGPRIKSL